MYTPPPSVRYHGFLLDTWLTTKKTRTQYTFAYYIDSYTAVHRESNHSQWVKNKLTLYKTLLKPMWTHGIDFWGHRNHRTPGITNVLRTLPMLPFTFLTEPFTLTSSYLLLKTVSHYASPPWQAPRNVDTGRLLLTCIVIASCNMHRDIVETKYK